MSPLKLVYLKEMREMLRDRRILMSSFVLPIFVMYMMTQLFAFIGNTLGNEKNTAIYVTRSQSLEPLVASLKAVPKNDVTVVASLDEGKKALEEGKAKVLLELPELDPATAKQITIKAYFNSDSNTSSLALRKVETWAQASNQAALNVALKSVNLPPETAEPVKITPEDQAKTKGAGDSILVSLLPYMLILFVFSGGLSIASDLVAGEKERGTLETLLISPVERIQIALGKFFSLLSFSLATALVSIGALLILGLTNPMTKKVMFPDSLGITPVTLISLVLVVLSMAAFFAAIQLWASIQAKNMREAQTLLGLMNVVVIIPAAFSQLLGLTGISKSFWVSFAPVLNGAVSLRETMLGNFNPVGTVLTIVWNLALAGLALWLSVRMFRSETVLAKS